MKKTAVKNNADAMKLLEESQEISEEDIEAEIMRDNHCSHNLAVAMYEAIIGRNYVPHIPIVVPGVELNEDVDNRGKE